MATLAEAGVQTLVDVRRHPASRRNPQFNERTLAGLIADLLAATLSREAEARE